MKVVYEDTIVKRIQRAVYDADAENRRIGYIEVTVREAGRCSGSGRAGVTGLVDCSGPRAEPNPDIRAGMQ
jgi:hypothetical protein